MLEYWEENGKVEKSKIEETMKFLQQINKLRRFLIVLRRGVKYE